MNIAPEISTALEYGQPVVALESTVIAHGLPWPDNLETALAVENAVREEGAVPATIAVWEGQPTIGLTGEQLETLAQAQDILKASRRDLGIAIAGRRTAATTVAATAFLAYEADIRIFATGGIGGAHRDSGQTWDISADLFELSRLPVAVVCAGAKSILDIRRTLEILETYSVPVLGYGSDTFPAFYLPSSGEPVSARIDCAEEAVSLLLAHWQYGGCGVVIAQPIAQDAAVDAEEYENALRDVEQQAVQQGIRGKELTPFLLAGLAQATAGKTLRANQTLLVANARLAAQIAAVLCCS